MTLMYTKQYVSTAVAQRVITYRLRNNRYTAYPTPTSLHICGTEKNRGKIFSREDIFAGRYFRERIFSREDIFAGRYFRVNSIFAKISSRENISNSLFAKFSSRENKVFYSRLQDTDLL